MEEKKPTFDDKSENNDESFQEKSESSSEKAPVSDAQTPSESFEAKSESSVEKSSEPLIKEDSFEKTPSESEKPSESPIMTDDDYDESGEFKKVEIEEGPEGIQLVSDAPKEMLSDDFQVQGSTLWQVVTGILAVLLIVSIFTNGFRFGDDATDVVVPEPVVPPTPTQVTRLDVSVDDDPQKGLDDAKVTIIEFSDFECPFCGRAQATIQQIEEAYGDDVRFIFRDFPLSLHQNAQPAAEAAQCANDQNKYWEYHDVLFSNQQKLDANSLLDYAEDLGLDMDEFEKCVTDRTHRSEVIADTEDGKTVGVRGTPAFFINGRPLTGAQPFSSFKTIIDEELAS